jgi:hypothetical protein
MLLNSSVASELSVYVTSFTQKPYIAEEGLLPLHIREVLVSNFCPEISYYERFFMVFLRATSQTAE